jgi:hypothetical protein
MFQGSRYPLNPNAKIKPSRPTPLSHVSSRGRRYACRNTTLNMWMNAVRIMRFADQL